MILSFFSKNQRVFVFVCALVLLDGWLEAAKPKSKSMKDNSSFFEKVFPFPSGFGFSEPKLSKTFERLRELELIPAARENVQKQIEAINRKLSDDDLSDEEKKMAEEDLAAWKDALKYLRDALKSDDKYGRAVASGLAGDEWKALRDEHIQNVWEGLKLGGLLRISRVCGDVLCDRIKDSVDRVVGGTWDFCVGKMIDGYDIVSQELFHSGKPPFAKTQLEGWQELIKVCFEDIERLLKDGLKDSLRGRDMTLRVVEEGQEQQVLNAWMILIGGYVRQFDYVIVCINKHLAYYGVSCDENINNDSEKNNDCDTDINSKDENLVFYAKEIKRRLVEVIQLLTQCKTLKDFCNLLDSNTILILALRKNIDNLFKRLIEELPKPRATKNQSTSSTGRDSSLRMDNGNSSLGTGSMDDEYFPHSMRNSAW